MPNLGEIKKSQDLGYKGMSISYIWTACIDCGKERWVQVHKGVPKNTKCRSCGNKKGRKLCFMCNKNPREKNGCYCIKCHRKIRLVFYHKNKKCGNAKHLTEQERKKYKAHKDARRRARLHNCMTTLTQLEWDNIKALYRYRCVYCGEKPKILTKDHIIPLSKGGEHSLRNIVPACRSCNSYKNAGAPNPFQQLLTTTG